MDAHGDGGESLREEELGSFSPQRLVGLEGRLTRPFWGLMGGWAVLCGALASNELRWAGDQQSWISNQLLTLVLVMLLADLAWGSLWDLATGRDWFRVLGGRWPPEQPGVLPSLPYTQPGSPGGRLFGGLDRLVGWWRATFWPRAGPALLGLLAAAVLAWALTMTLPDRLRPLNLALAGLIGLGVIQRRRGREPLALQAAVLVGLSWLAGHAAFAPSGAGLGSTGSSSLVLSLAFVAATWGVLCAGKGLPRGTERDRPRPLTGICVGTEPPSCGGDLRRDRPRRTDRDRPRRADRDRPRRTDRDRPRGLWLVNGGQVVAVGLLVWLKQPLLAGVAGLLLFGQIALQTGSRFGAAPAEGARRIWPWLMLTMLVAALALR